MTNVWFTADWHLGHHNIVSHCNRPFPNVREMNEAILTNFTDYVKKTDKVYFLGDIAWKPLVLHYAATMLPGRWTFLLGNHDEQLRNRLTRLPFIERVERLINTRIEGYSVTLCHYPLLSWNKSTHNSLHFHGHCHGTLSILHPRRVDVGVDSWEFRPVHLDEILQLIRQRGETYVQKGD